MVQLPRQAMLDTLPSDNRTDLADSLSDHPGQLRVRLRTGDPKESAVARGIAIRHQPYSELDLHSDPVWNAEPAVGCVGYSGRMGDDHLVHGRNLAALQMGCRGSSAKLHLGIACDCIANEHHLDELGTSMILGIFQSTITQIMPGGLADSTLDSITHN